MTGPDLERRTLGVLAYVNATHGLSYRFVRRLAGGMMSGASEVCDADGRRAVLKWSTDRSWAEQVLRAGPAVERAKPPAVRANRRAVRAVPGDEPAGLLLCAAAGFFTGTVFLALRNPAGPGRPLRHHRSPARRAG